MKIINDKHIFTDLPWDTEYFGLKSGKLVLKKEINKKDIKEILEKNKMYEFITITNENNNAQNNKIIGETTNSFLADINMQFSRKISNEIIKSYDSQEIRIEEAINPSREILQIGEKAFIHSRFYNDSNLSIERSKLIYVNWLKNAFNKIGKYFVKFIDEKNITLGFLLFSIDKNVGIIELIAVDPSTSIKGIGQKMIKSLISFLALKKVETISVGTQGNNLKAQNFYYYCGFRLVACHSIYHCWNL